MVVLTQVRSWALVEQRQELPQALYFRPAVRRGSCTMQARAAG